MTDTYRNNHIETQRNKETQSPALINRKGKAQKRHMTIREREKQKYRGTDRQGRDRHR